MSDYEVGFTWTSKDGDKIYSFLRWHEPGVLNEMYAGIRFQRSGETEQEKTAYLGSTDEFDPHEWHQLELSHKPPEEEPYRPTLTLKVDEVVKISAWTPT